MGSVMSTEGNVMNKYVRRILLLSLLDTDSLLQTRSGRSETRWGFKAAELVARRRQSHLVPSSTFKDAERAMFRQRAHKSEGGSVAGFRKREDSFMRVGEDYIRHASDTGVYTFRFYIARTNITA